MPPKPALQPKKKDSTEDSEIDKDKEEPEEAHQEDERRMRKNGFQ
jgi:hypothetical protein